MTMREPTPRERLRADANRALFWTIVNGSSEDAMRASDPATRATAGDPYCNRAMLACTRRMRDDATDRRLAELRSAS